MVKLNSNYQTLTKTVISRVTDYGRKPLSEYQALHQARLLLEEEGRWCTDDLFQDGDPMEVFENGSFCGAWQVCAAGAVGVVTGDMPIKITKEWYVGPKTVWSEMGDADYEWDAPDESVSFGPDTLSFRALQVLAVAIKLDNAEIEQHLSSGIWRYEDERDVGWLTDPTSVVFNGNDGSTRESVIKYFKSAEELAKNKKKYAKIVADIKLEQHVFEVEVYAEDKEAAVKALASRLTPQVDGHAVHSYYC